MMRAAMSICEVRNHCSLMLVIDCARLLKSSPIDTMDTAAAFWRQMLRKATFDRSMEMTVCCVISAMSETAKQLTLFIWAAVW